VNGTNRGNETEILSQGNSLFATVRVASKSKQTGYLTMKRLIDFLLSLGGLIVLLPLLMLIALLIKLENPRGMVFFKQTRIGKDEKPFTIYKFRSMVTNAEQMQGSLVNHNEIEGAMFKMKKDPRVTKVGQWIRKTSLDEMPQLWNVLKGDMSLVGPRPPLPNEVSVYSDYEKLRLSVIPGCTGLWQVSGRNHVGFKEMVELDLTYIRERNLWFDLKILFRTIGVMIGSKGAF
jgi:lipopolysaccharide/colanic/teichoic acid biosynthesis glycosyltransferase